MLLPLLVTTSMIAAGPSSGRLAVLEIAAFPADAALAAELTAKVVEVLRGLDGVEIVTPDDVRAQHPDEAADILACAEEACAPGVVEKLGTQLVVVGRLTRGEGKIIQTLA